MKAGLLYPAGQRRLQLADPDLYARDACRQCGDLLPDIQAEGLQQAYRVGEHGPDDPVDLLVVDRMGQLVLPAGWLQVQVYPDIHDEMIAGPPLLLVVAMMPVYGDALQADRALHDSGLWDQI